MDCVPVLVILDVKPFRGFNIDLDGRVLDRPALPVDGSQVYLGDPVVDPVGEDLDQHRDTRIGNDLLDPVMVFIVEVTGAAEHSDEGGAEVLPGLPAHRKLLLKTGEGFGHVRAEAVHVGHREGPEPF